MQMDLSGIVGVRVSVRERVAGGMRVVEVGAYLGDKWWVGVVD